MSTAPVSSSPVSSPVTVITGSIALRSTCRLRIVVLVRPFASAVRTKSSSCTSSTDARVIRKITANGMVPSAIQGRIRCLTASQAASHSRVISPSRMKSPVTRVASMPGVCRPDGGSQAPA